MPIKRVNRGKGHSYIDTDTGLKIPGVTTINNDGVPKPKLTNWAATVTAEYAVDHWDELSALPPAARLKELNGARWKSNDEGKSRGTQVHKLAEALVRGDRVAIPAGLEGHVEAYVQFLDDFDVRPVEVERTIYSPQHYYCGTFDLVADLLDPEDLAIDPEVRSRERWLLDVKTARSGIFGETALQLAGYRFAEFMVDEVGEVEPMVEVDRCGAVHVRPDGYDLIPVEAEEAQLRAFLYVQQVAQFLANSRDLVGQPIISPQTSVYRLAKD
jgi:hypothetical protein